MTAPLRIHPPACAPVRIHPLLPLDALAVVTDPARYGHRMLLRRLAWAALMHARGRICHQHRLAAMVAAAGRGNGDGR